MCETFNIEGSDFEENHRKGDENCQQGWCGGWGLPKRCKCGGLIHADFLEEDYDNVYLAKGCDCCGKDYDEA